MSNFNSSLSAQEIEAALIKAQSSLNTEEVEALIPTAPQAPTISVGTVTTGAAGTEASITETGTEQNKILNFVIPKGDQGDKGDKGDTGAPGTSTGGGDGYMPGVLNINSLEDIQYTLETALAKVWSTLGTTMKRGQIITYRVSANGSTPTVWETKQWIYAGSIIEMWVKNVPSWVEYTLPPQFQYSPYLNINDYEWKQYTFDEATRKAWLIYKSLTPVMRGGVIVTYLNTENKWVTMQFIYATKEDFVEGHFINATYWTVIATSSYVEATRQALEKKLNIINLNLFEDVVYTWETAITKLLTIVPFNVLKGGISIKYRTTNNGSTQRETYETYTFNMRDGSTEVKVRDINNWDKIYTAFEDAPADNQIYARINNSWGRLSTQSKNLFNWGEIPKNKEDIKVITIGNSFAAQLTNYVPEFKTKSGHTQIEHATFAAGGTDFATWIDHIKNKTETGLDLIASLETGNWDIITLQALSTDAWVLSKLYPDFVELATLIRRIVKNPKLAFFIYFAPVLPDDAAPSVGFESSQLLYDEAILTYETFISMAGIPTNRIIFGGTGMENLRARIKETSGLGLTYDGRHPLYGMPYYVTSAIAFQTIYEQVFDDIDVISYMQDGEIDLLPTHAEGVDYSKVLNMKSSNRHLAIDAVTWALMDRTHYYSELAEVVEISDLNVYNTNLT